MKFENTAAVVTGGASGLGAATARALAAAGAKVALFDMNAEKGEAFATEIGGIFCKVDVRSDDEVDAGFAKARAAHGQERILVNCAGVGNAFKTVGRDKATGEIRQFPAAAFDWVIQVNLVGRTMPASRSRCCATPISTARTCGSTARSAWRRGEQLARRPRTHRPRRRRRALL